MPSSNDAKVDRLCLVCHAFTQGWDIKATAPWGSQEQRSRNAKRKHKNAEMGQGNQNPIPSDKRRLWVLLAPCPPLAINVSICRDILVVFEVSSDCSCVDLVKCRCIVFERLPSCGSHGLQYRLTGRVAAWSCSALLLVGRLRAGRHSALLMDWGGTWRL